MSTAKFDTLSNVAGTQTVPVATVAQGSAKAWVNFNGTGTVAIRASFNVSSITDNGVGQYTVNFTTNMPDANYSIVIGHSGGTTTNPTSLSHFSHATNGFELIAHQGSNIPFDQAHCHVSIFR
jgi:hypothetical protein